jgi:hypothetical protein
MRLLCFSQTPQYGWVRTRFPLLIAGPSSLGIGAALGPANPSQQQTPVTVSKKRVRQPDLFGGIFGHVQRPSFLG